MRGSAECHRRGWDSSSSSESPLTQLDVIHDMESLLLLFQDQPINLCERLRDILGNNLPNDVVRDSKVDVEKYITKSGYRLPIYFICLCPYLLRNRLDGLADDSQGVDHGVVGGLVSLKRLLVNPLGQPNYSF